MTKETIIFYKEWLTLINSLPDKSRLEFYDIIFSQDKVVLSKIKDAHLRSVLDFVKQKIDKNHVKYEEIISKRKLAGIKSGEARRKKGTKRASVKSVQQKGTKRTDSDNVNVNDSDNVSDNGNELISNKDDLFESFWKHYVPVKTKDGVVAKGHRKAAKQSFFKALKKASFETIMSKLEEYLNYCQENNRYTKQASVWLNNEGWEDDFDNVIMAKQDSHLNQYQRVLGGLNNGN